VTDLTIVIIGARLRVLLYSRGCEFYSVRIGSGYLLSVVRDRGTYLIIDKEEFDVIYLYRLLLLYRLPGLEVKFGTRDKAVNK
jgi:hypothetical protein